MARTNTLDSNRARTKDCIYSNHSSAKSIRTPWRHFGNHGELTVQVSTSAATAKLPNACKLNSHTPEDDLSLTYSSGFALIVIANTGNISARLSPNSTSQFTLKVRLPIPL